jgi:O-antigen ligase
MNPNEVGMLSVVGIGACLVEIKLNKSKVKNIIFILIGLVALMQTQSRSSQIGFCLVFFYFIWTLPNKQIRNYVVITAGISMPFLLSVTLLAKGDVSELFSLTGRLPFWKALLTEGLPQRPLFGFGFMRISVGDRFESIGTYAGAMAHNTFIQVLMNLGLVGFSIILTQMIATIRAFSKSKIITDNLFFVGLFIPIFINSLSDFGIFGEYNYGILFYQFLIFLVCIDFDPRLTRIGKLKLKKYRPEIYKSLYVDNIKQGKSPQLKPLLNNALTE